MVSKTASQMNYYLNVSSDDSGFYSPGNQLRSSGTDLLANPGVENEDCLTPLKSFERKPSSFYRKNTEKSFVKQQVENLNNNSKTKEAERKNLNKKQSKNSGALKTSPRLNSYQTTFIRIWPSDSSDARLNFVSVVNNIVLEVNGRSHAMAFERNQKQTLFVFVIPPFL